MLSFPPDFYMAGTQWPTNMNLMNEIQLREGKIVA